MLEAGLLEARRGLIVRDACQRRVGHATRLVRCMLARTVAATLGCAPSTGRRVGVAATRVSHKRVFTPRPFARGERELAAVEAAHVGALGGASLNIRGIRFHPKKLHPSFV